MSKLSDYIEIIERKRVAVCNEGLTLDYSQGDNWMRILSDKFYATKDNITETWIHRAKIDILIEMLQQMKEKINQLEEVK